MTTYAKHISRRETPSTEPIPGKPMIQNSAGGYSFQADMWSRLDRWLILGCDGGSYYASERKMTVDNAKAVQACLDADGSRTVHHITTISESGRAPKNEPAIFALALAASHGCGTAGVDQHTETRQAALAALPRVARIPTHLFQFVQTVEELRGHGRALNRALQDWYLNKPIRELAYQVSKYQQRDGWSHRDVLRLCKPKTDSNAHNAIFYWCTKGWEGVGEDPHDNSDLLPIWAFERAKRATTVKEIVKLITDYRLVRECVPTQWLNEPSVWEALLRDMPMAAMVRNLATMTRCGLIAPLSEGTRDVTMALRDEERLRKSRIHPIALLSALLTYKSGHGQRGHHNWTPVNSVVDALDAAFYMAFKNVEPSGKTHLIALDVSGSMSSGDIAGVPGLTPRVASAAMALVTMAVEPRCYIVGFSHQLVEIEISPRQRLDDVVNIVTNIPMGGTDCALPMVWASTNKVPVDVFMTLTDSEHWAGNIHPAQALNAYRQRMNKPSRAVCVGMVANDFTVLDPTDPGSLNVSGFDTATPALIADFASGTI